MLSERKELKEIEAKLEELEIKILRKKYRNETRGSKILTEQEIELVEKKQIKEDETGNCKRRIDIKISEAEDLCKVNEMKKIRTKINELEKEKDLACISMTERLCGY